jgi:hypothetical protein
VHRKGIDLLCENFEKLFVCTLPEMLMRSHEHLTINTLSVFQELS